MLMMLIVVPLVGCDSVGEKPKIDVPVNIQAELQALQTLVIGPAMERASKLSPEEREQLAELAAEARQLLATDGASEADINRANAQLSQAISKILTAQDVSIIKKTTARIAEAKPELRGMKVGQAMEVLMQEVGLGKTADCNGTCAAQAGVKVVAIEAAFIGAVIGCTSLTALAGLCIGAAILAKNALIADRAISLVQCTDMCQFMAN